MFLTFIFSASFQMMEVFSATNHQEKNSKSSCSHQRRRTSSIGMFSPLKIDECVFCTAQTIMSAKSNMLAESTLIKKNSLFPKIPVKLIAGDVRVWPRFGCFCSISLWLYQLLCNSNSFSQSQILKLLILMKNVWLTRLERVFFVGWLDVQMKRFIEISPKNLLISKGSRF